MITLTVYVSGDHWLNPEEIRDKLRAVPPTERLEIKFNTEGPSLAALGVLDMLTAWCQDTKRSPDTVFLADWVNDVESVPFPRSVRFNVSHFFWLCERYITDIAEATHERRFGIFIGRRTSSRMRMIWDLWQRHRERCLFSLMPNISRFDPYRISTGIDLDTMDMWAPRENIKEFLSWCQDPPIDSIDGHCVQDQYSPDQNTNRDLLAHYHRFNIEIVAETYTRGDCFMPTEKTVRPLSAGKPVLIHGPKNFLSRLQDMGFKTYGDYWDESYDRLEGLERWQAILDIIDRLSQEQLFPDMAPIGRHNRSHVRDVMTKHRPR